MARDTDSRRAAPAGGDHRLGPTAGELLGQRARSRPAGDVDATDEAVPVTELPQLREDVYLLEPEATAARRRRSAVRGPLQGLALDTALSAGGDVVWIDTQAHATTHTLASVAPSRAALDRVQVARAFTAGQHHTLVERLGRWLDGAAPGPFGDPGTDRPAVVVCPAVDALYRGSDRRERESAAMLARALAVLRRVAADHGIPVVLTRADGDAEPVARAATTIRLVRTAFGARLDCPALAFETLAYPVDAGVVQTTLAFWREVLGARHPGVAADDGPTITPATLSG